MSTAGRAPKSNHVTPSPSRRSLLAAGSALAGGFVIGGTRVSGRVLGANDEIRVAIAGVNGFGVSHIRALSEQGSGARVTYLADPDERLFESRRSLTARYGAAAQCVTDLQRALDDPQVDAVVIATCDHWHAPLTVRALAAGKHVFVEPPLGHTYAEGKRCVAAANKAKRVVQVGLAYRGAPLRARQIAAVKSGDYGQLTGVKIHYRKPRWPLPPKPTTAPPPGFDFARWLGPATRRPFHGNLHPYNWRWLWDFGCGELGGQAIHELDLARWAIGDSQTLQQVWSVGARLHGKRKDNAETPNSLVACWKFENATVVLESRCFAPSRKSDSQQRSVVFETTDGVIRGNKFFAQGGAKGEQLKGDAEFTLRGGVSGFIAAVAANRPDLAAADATIGHQTSALSHLANISYRLGKEQPTVEPRMERDFVDGALGRLRAELRRANTIAPGQTLRVGPVLTFDAATDKFADQPQADQLLTKAYSKSFSW